MKRICSFGTYFGWLTLLTRVIWPDPEGGLSPGTQLLPFFIFIGLMESLAFGAGMSLLVNGWRKFESHRLVFLAVVWSLISWWPHDSLHRVMPEGDLVQLLRIEYGFHVTLILAGLVVARYLWTQFDN